MSEHADEPMITGDHQPEPSTTEQHTFVKPRVDVSKNEVEKMEEAKLKAKFPMATNFPLSGHSAFLQKKLAKGQKYFDSGDYMMAKQTCVGGALNSNKSRQMANCNTAALTFGTGEAIPTPESVPVRKTSIIQPKFAPSSTT